MEKSPLCHALASGHPRFKSILNALAMGLLQKSLDKQP
jgi:hypothetical protein